MVVATKPIESFVPPDILDTLIHLNALNGWSDTRLYNNYLYTNKPNIPRSSVKRWTKAFVDGRAHSETPTWHTYYRDTTSILSEKYSDVSNGKYKEEREKWARDGYIRYVNISDFHRPNNDNALLLLALQIIKDYQPNVFPFYSDWFDMNAFKPHPTRPFEAGNKNTPNKYTEFEQLITETTDLIVSVLPKNCSRLNLWGNHENWILKRLLNIASTHAENDLMEWVIEKFFTLFQKYNVLWLEADANKYIPLTEHFWVGHGDKSRQGLGATARAYLNETVGAVSIAAGHSHRQEVLFQKSPVAEHFAAIAGTMGNLQPNYARAGAMGHNWGFQLITHPFVGWEGVAVEDIRINYRDGYYISFWRGQEYSQKANWEYNRYLK